MIVLLPSSATVVLLTTVSVGASFVGVTVALIVFLTLAPSSSVAIIVIVSVPLKSLFERYMISEPSTLTVPFSALAVIFSIVPSSSLSVNVSAVD